MIKEFVIWPKHLQLKIRRRACNLFAQSKLFSNRLFHIVTQKQKAAPYNETAYLLLVTKLKYPYSFKTVFIALLYSGSFLIFTLTTF